MSLFCPDWADPTANFQALRAELEGHLGRRMDEALGVFKGSAPAPLQRYHEAMAYGVLGGGKRVRGLLVLLAADAAADPSAAFSVELREACLDAAAALEAVHAYSLIHDDLPCMDDDDLRRGRPTVHRAYDEATALLAGDGLQTLAFDWLAQAKCSPAVGLEMVGLLARASGLRGMAGGQAIDIAEVGQALDLESLRLMHRLKTGALIVAAVEMGLVLGQSTAPAQGRPPVSQQAERAALLAYSRHLGLAFQVQDDVLDVTASTADLGKTAGKDAAQHKPTFVSLLGLEGAQAEARRLHDEALVALQPLQQRAEGLRQLAELLLTRAS